MENSEQVTVSAKRKPGGLRIFLDILVIIMALLTFLPHIVGLFSGGYSDDGVIPDDILALDEEISTFLESIEPDFQDLYSNIVRPDVYSFSYYEGEKVWLSNQENYNQSVKSTVYINTEDFTGFYLGTGSVLTSDGVILTNFHVIDGADKVVVTTHDKKTYKVESVLASDESLDIAVLKIAAEGLQPIPIGDSDTVTIGDEVLVIGNSEGLINSLSTGIISGIRDYSSQDAGVQFQITNPISAGNSGGMLLNEYGEIIGVPSWAIEYEDNIVQVQNLNFAVPINEVINMLIEG